MIGHPVAAIGIGVSMFTTAFAPTHVDVVAGDAVTWTNDSVRKHTVTAQDGTWTSAEVFAGEQYAHAFDHTGTALYYCRIHPFMRGEVDVHSVLMTAPAEPGAPRRPYTLAGRSSLPVGTAVTLEGDDGSGFRTVTSTTVGDDGAFHAPVVPAATTRYRAVAGGETSPAVQLLVLDRHVDATNTLGARRTIVHVRVDPASPHATVVLQLHLRERFGWWPVRAKRLDHHSMAMFRIATHGRRLRARAVLTLADGATPLARSEVFRVGRRR
jgi:plastocyanin